MDVYVKTRGVSRGYSWVNQDETIVNPPLFTEGVKIVDTDDFSLILYRMKGKLSLLITGLETKDRTDNRTRRIRNSVLWVGDDSNDEEEILRKIAIKALNKQLEEDVDEAVKSDNNDQGFKVDFNILKNLKLDPLKPAENKLADSRRIGNWPTLKNELIEELLNYRLPEKKEGMLVVVSSTVSHTNLENNVVWRGLSDTIPGDEWIDLPVKGDQDDSFRPDSTTGKVASKSGNSAQESIRAKTQPGNSRTNDKISTEVIQKQGLTIGQTVVSILLVISLIANIGLFLKWQDAIDNKKEYEKLLEQSQALKVEIVNNENKIKTQEKKIDEQNLNLQKGGKILDGIQKFTARFNSPELRELLEDNNDFLKGIQK